MMLSDILVVDVETTISNKGNPFDKTNRLVLYGDYDGKTYRILEPDKDIGDITNKLIIGFNVKFDLLWLKRHYGIDFGRLSVWDCALAEFILEHQSNPYPSLDSTASRYAIGNKLDCVFSDYWDKGIDTDQIPREILDEYLRKDLELTYEVFLKQHSLLKDSPNKYKLFRLQCKDLLTLCEMEWNGLNLDLEKVNERASQTDKEIQSLNNAIYFTYHVSLEKEAPIELLNLDSTQDRSTLLYGGNYTHTERIPIGEYKTGLKVGQTRYSKIKREFEFQQLIRPGQHHSQTFYSTDEKTINSILLNKSINEETRFFVELIQKRQKLKKLHSTYLVGIPELMQKYNWDDGTIHSTFNQTRAATSRLSSSKPNAQNYPDEFLKYIVTRFDDGC